MILALIAATLAAAPAVRPDIPRLTWTPRSDWVNARTLGARADGRADDTAVLQAALDQVGKGKAAYLPAGTYRITRTLVLQGPITGGLVVGHGAATRVVWDGAPGGVMLRSNGAAYSRYVGIAWEGGGRAGVGVDHDSDCRFETEVTHSNESFRGFTGCGIRIGNGSKLASAEILYRNCLFEDSGIGIGFFAFNDYDNTIDHCDFRRCGQAVHDDHGNFYARNCHFESSRQCDFSIHSEHGDSIRRCTSRGSRAFVIRGTIAPLTIQDCHVAEWSDPQGAVQLAGAPVLIFDSSFATGPAGVPPVRLLNADLRLSICGNSPASEAALLGTGPHPGLVVVPPGKLKGVVDPNRRSALLPPTPLEGHLFDAVAACGARGDGVADDTAALQKAIDLARARGGNAIAYMPAGRYRITHTLKLAGGGYRLSGAGWRTGLVWAGEPGLPMLSVADPAGLQLEHLMVGGHDLGQMNHGEDILVATPSGRPGRLVIDQVFAFGMYQKQPDRHGVRFHQLARGSRVDVRHLQGNVQVDGCGDSTLLFRTSYEGTVSLRGANGGGLVGFMTRLATSAGPTLHVYGNRSVTMSDFYDEQSDSHLLLEGGPGDAPGMVTVTGPKTHLFTKQPVIELRGFAGRLFYGMNQFYIEPAESRIVASGDRAATIAIAGCYSYNTHATWELSPGVRGLAVGNAGIEDRDAAEALKAFSSALDDLRRLGAADVR